MHSPNGPEGSPPASQVEDYLVFGEFGEVNPSISDGSTFTFLDPEKLKAIFHGPVPGCHLYSRLDSPSTQVLAHALALLEEMPAGHVTASGMAAIACTLFNFCTQGTEIVSDRLVYGGTYALLKNFLPRLGIRTRFVDFTDPDQVRKVLTPKTRVLYCESLSNPLLRAPDLSQMAEIAHGIGARLVVDNTFAPLLFTPRRQGADVVIHSLTKFINGMSDCVAGVITADESVIRELSDASSGASMLLGPALDSTRAASIFKNLHTLPVRLLQHGKNAQALADRLAEAGIRVSYPGRPDYPDRAVWQRQADPRMGHGGMMTIDLGEESRAQALMLALQAKRVGLLAVSLGYYRTLFSPPGSSTSSEIPEADRAATGLGPGLIRFSVGLDFDLERTWGRFAACLRTVGAIAS